MVARCYTVRIFSFDLIMVKRYACLVGRPPFETSEVKKTYKRIKRNAYSFPDHVNLSEYAKSLIARLLVLDPCIYNQFIFNF